MAAIVLTNPPEYDLHALAESTRNSLAVLKPWTLLDTTNNPLAKQIVVQARNYVSAIQLGVSAAYSGFTVTEEVLFLASALPIEDKEDLQDYLKGMMELAKEARDNSNKAFCAFRNVRQEILGTLDKIREEKAVSQDQETEGSTSNHRGLPPHSKDDIEVLVKFSESISRFANWWDWIKVETDTSSAKGQLISCQLDVLKEASTVKRWNHLRSQYTAYVQLISELEDADPVFFKRVSTPDMFHSCATTSAVGLIEAKPQHEASTDTERHVPPASPSVATTTTTTTNGSVAPELSPETHPHTQHSVNLRKDGQDCNAPCPKSEKHNIGSLFKKFLEHMAKHKRFFKYVKNPLQRKSKDGSHFGNHPVNEEKGSKDRNGKVKPIRQNSLTSLDTSTARQPSPSTAEDPYHLSWKSC